jgi:hypothetical protein
MDSELCVSFSGANIKKGFDMTILFLMKNIFFGENNLFEGFTPTE